MKAREYSGPLGILAAGAIGLSLLCGVSAMAMGDLRRYIPITLEPLSIVDLAVANFETAAALTEQIVTVFVPTATVTPTGTASLVPPTPPPSDTPRRFVTITPTEVRRTRIPPTPTVAPSRTSTPRPPTATRTRTPSRTPVTPSRTPVTPTLRPTFTNTPITPTTPPYPELPTSTSTPPPPYP